MKTAAPNTLLMYMQRLAHLHISSLFEQYTSLVGAGAGAAAALNG